MNQHSLLGQQAEQFVAHALEREGFTLLTRNYRQFYGEIDIIARKKDTIVFVEVKVRRVQIDHMAEIVTYTKQRKIIQVAQTYIAQHQLINMYFRFDVALVIAGQDGFSMQYIENAFQE